MSRRGENIYKRKDGRWEGRYKKGYAPDGSTLYGYCYSKTYREVKEKLHILSSPTENKQAQTNHSKKHFGLYCDDWLSSCKNRVKASTLATYTTALENHIKPFFGGYLPTNITTEAIDSFTAQMMNGKGLSAKTVKDYLVVMKSVLKYVARVQGTVNNVEINMPKQTQEEMRVLSVGEQNALILYLLTDMDNYKFGTLFALMTGLRIGEVCALRCGDISLKEKTVRVSETM